VAVCQQCRILTTQGGGGGGGGVLGGGGWDRANGVSFSAARSCEDLNRTRADGEEDETIRKLEKFGISSRGTSLRTDQVEILRPQDERNTVDVMSFSLA